MRNAGLDEAQAGIMIARRNINNLRYADDTTLMAESEEELKSFLMKVKEESENAGLKLNIQKTKIMASGPITSWQIDGETVETVVVFQSLSRVWLFATPGLQHAMIPWSLLNLMSIESVMPFNHAVHGGRKESDRTEPLSNARAEVTETRFPREKHCERTEPQSAKKETPQKTLKHMIKSLK